MKRVEGSVLAHCVLFSGSAILLEIPPVFAFHGKQSWLDLEFIEFSLRKEMYHTFGFLGWHTLHRGRMDTHFDLPSMATKILVVSVTHYKIELLELWSHLRMNAL